MMLRNLNAPRPRPSAIPLALLGVALVALSGMPCPAQQPQKKPKLVREIFVPFSELETLLEAQAQRVYLDKQQYEDLLRRAARRSPRQPPQKYAVLGARYRATLQEGGARILAEIEVEAMSDRLTAVPLRLAGVGMRLATLDGKPAALARKNRSEIVLFIKGKGRKQLRMELTAPLTTDAAQQRLDLQLPQSASTAFTLTAPGNVELKSGADVLKREVIQNGDATRFDLAARKGRQTITLSLNNRRRQRDRVVVSRSVLVDEITQAYERLHVTSSFEVLHGSLDQLRFAVPKGWEITDVRTENLSKWSIEKDPQGAPILSVRLRSPTTSLVTCSIVADNEAPQLNNWRFPDWKPLDTKGDSAVVGVLLEDRLNQQAYQSDGLLPIDNAILVEALPTSVLKAEPGQPRIQPALAFYAPQASHQLRGSFSKPPGELQVIKDLLISAADDRVRVRGALLLTPRYERRFFVDILAPAGWRILEAGDGGKTKFALESYDADGGGKRVRVRLPSSLASGQQQQLYFQAEQLSEQWLGAWTEKEIVIPRFRVVDADRQQGAVAIQVRDDLRVRPLDMTGLTPLDDKQALQRFGAGQAALAFRFDGEYTGQLRFERITPLVSGRSYTFVRLEPNRLSVHIELVFDVQRAGIRDLAFRLPESTPSAILIRGLGGVQVKGFDSQTADGKRTWTAHLAKKRSGEIRLQIDFEQNWQGGPPPQSDTPLPSLVVDGYQTAVVAAEGHPELDVTIETKARRIDVGELAAAQYQPGKRLLGAFEFVGAPNGFQLQVVRRQGASIPPVIVERAELTTLVGVNGRAQTAGRFLLRTRASFLELQLPDAAARLWSVQLDGKPMTPQRDGKRLLLSLPSGKPGRRDLQVVYESSIRAIYGFGRFAVGAPKLLSRGKSSATTREAPLADLQWSVVLPRGYRVTDSDGTVYRKEKAEPIAMWAGARAIALALDDASATTPFDKVAALVASSEEATKQEAPEMGGAADSSMPAPGFSYDSRPVRRASKKMPPPPSATPSPATPPQASAPAGNAPGAAGAAGMGGFGGGADPFGMAPAGAGAVPPQTKKPKTRTPRSAATEGPQAGDRGQAPADGPAGDAEGGQGLDSKQRDDKKKRSLWVLEGVRSLSIDVRQAVNLAKDDEVVVFHSLGVQPQLQLDVANGQRIDTAAWTWGLIVFAVGVLLTRTSIGAKSWYIALTMAASTLAAPLTGEEQLFGSLGQSGFTAALLLIPFYLAVYALQAVRNVSQRARKMVQSLVALLLFGLILTVAHSAFAQSGNKQLDALLEALRGGKPIVIPKDAVVIPYRLSDTEDVRESIGKADKVLVPYPTYVKLWNRANPDRPLNADKPPTEFAFAGAEYRAVLLDGKELQLEGTMLIDSFVEHSITVPLPLSGGALSNAQLDGKPAQLQVVSAINPRGPATTNRGSRQNDAPNGPAQAQPPNPDDANLNPGQQMQQQAGQAAFAGVGKPVIVLIAKGSGRKKLTFTLRFRTSRRGGWRVVEGRLPLAASSALTLRVPQAQTELRLSGVKDRTAYETTADNQTIQTAFDLANPFTLQWRPKVTEAQVDRSLTAQSDAVWDVQEEGLRLTWRVALRFRRTRRDTFSLQVPKDYLVERVEGQNVRGWAAKQEEQGQRLDVTLLKAVLERESFVIRLARRAAVGVGDLALVAAPVVSIPEAALHQGRFSVRRSPLLRLVVSQQTGFAQTDVPANLAKLAAIRQGEQSPLGVVPFQSYNFNTTQYRLTLQATPLATQTEGISAHLQTLVSVAANSASLATRVQLDSPRRPLHRVVIEIPTGFEVEEVKAPALLQWSVVAEGQKRVLHAFLDKGLQGSLTLIVSGWLGKRMPADPLPIPQLVVRDVQEQRGEIVVVSDPGFRVTVANARNLEVQPLTGGQTAARRQVQAWLSAENRALAKLLLTYTNSDHAGVLNFAALQPRVTCTTVTNVRISNQTIEETLLLEFRIRNAGVRELVFLTPASLEVRRANINAPQLRQITYEDLQRDGQPWTRVKVELQEELIGKALVIVEKDHLNTSDEHVAAVPVVEAAVAEVQQQYLTLENASRDEVAITAQEGVEPFGSRNAPPLLSGVDLQRAYVIRGGGRFAFRATRRQAVETAGARIELAETRLVLDASGAYRAIQHFHMDNRTEQFLDIALPDGAALWTAKVAGEPVKPAQAAGNQQVRLPLVKTAAGDPNFVVEVKYGGRMPPIASWTTVRFPLLKTVKINVERSQVELYLPKAYRWWNFGGSMTRVYSRADLQAGVVAYMTDQIEKATQTLSSGNDYDRARSASNLKNLGDAVRRLRSQIDDVPNAELDRNNAANDDALRKAGEQLKLQASRAQVRDATDNRMQFNELFFEQRNGRARNTLGRAGGNFSSVAPAPNAKGQPAERQGGRFDRSWLSRNKLEQRGPAQQRGKSRVVLGKDAPGKYVERPPIVKGLLNQGKSSKAGGQAASASKPTRSNRGRRRSQQELLDRYQRQLAQQQSTPAGVTFGEPRPERDSSPVSGGADTGGGEADESREGESGFGDARAVGRGELVSLDVEIPLRGTPFMFTTPRGQIEITAQPVAESMLDRSATIALVLAGLLVWTLIYRVGAGVQRRWSPQPEA